jgi:hypothetical protein
VKHHVIENAPFDRSRDKRRIVRALYDVSNSHQDVRGRTCHIQFRLYAKRSGLRPVNHADRLRFLQQYKSDYRRAVLFRQMTTIPTGSSGYTWQGWVVFSCTVVLVRRVASSGVHIGKRGAVLTRAVDTSGMRSLASETGPRAGAGLEQRLEHQNADVANGESV